MDEDGWNEIYGFHKSLFISGLFVHILLLAGGVAITMKSEHKMKSSQLIPQLKLMQQPKYHDAQRNKFSNVTLQREEESICSELSSGWNAIMVEYIDI